MAFGREHNSSNRHMPLAPRYNADFEKEDYFNEPASLRILDKHELRPWGKYPPQPSLGKIMKDLEKIKERTLHENVEPTLHGEQLPEKIPPLQQYDQIWIHGPPPFYNVIARLRFRRWWHCRPLRSEYLKAAETAQPWENELRGPRPLPRSPDEPGQREERTPMRVLLEVLIEAALRRRVRPLPRPRRRPPNLLPITNDARTQLRPWRPSRPSRYSERTQRLPPQLIPLRPANRRGPLQHEDMPLRWQHSRTLQPNRNLRRPPHLLPLRIDQGPRHNQVPAVARLHRYQLHISPRDLPPEIPELPLPLLIMAEVRPPIWPNLLHLLRPPAWPPPKRLK